MALRLGYRGGGRVTPDLGSLTLITVISVVTEHQLQEYCFTDTTLYRIIPPASCGSLVDCCHPHTLAWPTRPSESRNILLPKQKTTEANMFLDTSDTFRPLAVSYLAR